MPVREKCIKLLQAAERGALCLDGGIQEMEKIT